MTLNADIHIYTDGACSGNPGVGGYGIILEWVGNDYYKEFSEGFRYTTNNRMELMAVIKGLEKLKAPSQKVKIFTDSRYVSDAVEKGWVFSWEKVGFKNKKNGDLWRIFLTLYKKHKITIAWIKGHNGHPKNERCDLLATEAYKRKHLAIDAIFENEKLQIS